MSAAALAMFATGSGSSAVRASSADRLSGSTRGCRRALAKRSLPRQTTPVDGAGLLAKARLPTRRDRRWEVELAPLTRMQAWNVEEIKPGTELAVLGFTFAGEQGEAVLRAEYLFLGDKAYGLRSSPA